MATVRLNFQEDDVDQFEEQLEGALEEATPGDLRAMIGQAAKFLDADDRYNAAVEPTHINNATSTICTAARRLYQAATARQVPAAANA